MFSISDAETGVDIQIYDKFRYITKYRYITNPDNKFCLCCRKKIFVQKRLKFHLDFLGVF